jgi:hypothetical protein
VQQFYSIISHQLDLGRYISPPPSKTYLSHTQKQKQEDSYLEADAILAHILVSTLYKWVEWVSTTHPSPVLTWLRGRGPGAY